VWEGNDDRKIGIRKNDVMELLLKKNGKLEIIG
jgi:hypothetical protein